MEQISQNQGLQHIMEQIFIDLDHGKLLQCRKVNASWNSLLKNPSVWLKICLKNGFLTRHGKKWLKMIQTFHDDPMMKDKVLSYLMEINSIRIIVVENFNIFGVRNPHSKIKKDIHPFHRFLSASNDYYLPYTLIKKYLEKIDSTILKEPFFCFHKHKNMIHYAVCKQEVKLLKIFLPFVKNPNAPDQYGWTPIQRAAYHPQNYEMIKMLAPVSKNPNAPNPNGVTPIHLAACDMTKIENVEIIKLLVPLSDNPNAPHPRDGYTPLQYAAMNGISEIIKSLVPYTDNPNSPDPTGYTPIHFAACYGHVEVIRILAPLSDNPNAPDPEGFTPIHTAARSGNYEIIKILAPFLVDNPNTPDPNGATPVQHIKMYGSGQHSDIIEILTSFTDNLQ